MKSTPQALVTLLNDQQKFRKFFSVEIPFSSVLSTDRALIVCPFHADNDASAKFYENEDGSVTLFCFGCRRQYTSYDYVKRIMEEDPRSYFLRLFSMDMENMAMKAELFDFTPVKKDYGIDWKKASSFLPCIGSFLDQIYPSIPLE